MVASVTDWQRLTLMQSLPPKVVNDPDLDHLRIIEDTADRRADEMFGPGAWERRDLEIQTFEPYTRELEFEEEDGTITLWHDDSIYFRLDAQYRSTASFVRRTYVDGELRKMERITE